MSFITYAELLKGAECSTRKPDVLRRLDQLTRQVPVSYPTDPLICRHYAEQFTRLKAAGTPIGANNLWIARHALAESATLVTHNVREFERVQGLSVETWIVTLFRTPPAVAAAAVIRAWALDGPDVRKKS